MSIISRKNVFFISIVSATVLTLVGIWSWNNRFYSNLISVGCSAVKYEQGAEKGYLTLDYNENQILVDVTDEKLQNTLSERNLEDVIGANLEVKIPVKILKEYHADLKQINAFEYLAGHIFDGYLTLSDVFYTDLEEQ